MGSLPTCLWCHNTLLRHVRRSGVYWFCNSCRQEIHPMLIDLGQTHRSKAPLPEDSDLVEVQIPLKVVAALNLSDDFADLPFLETRPGSESSGVAG